MFMPLTRRLYCFLDRPLRFSHPFSMSLRDLNGDRPRTTWNSSPIVKSSPSSAAILLPANSSSTRWGGDSVSSVGYWTASLGVPTSDASDHSLTLTCVGSSMSPAKVRSGSRNSRSTDSAYLGEPAPTSLNAEGSAEGEWLAARC